MSQVNDVSVCIIKWKWGTMRWDFAAIQTNKATNLIEKNK